MCTAAYNYMVKLYLNNYAEFCSTDLIPWPNINLPQHVGKIVTQYGFWTRALPLFTELHKIWYRYDETKKKFVKIVPICIDEMFSPVSLAHWIIDDGYFNKGLKTLILCTDCFTLEDYQKLQSLLFKYGIETILNVRYKEKGNYRIKILKKKYTTCSNFSCPTHA